MLFKILELISKVFFYGVEKILLCIVFISWCIEEDVNGFFEDFKEKNDKVFFNDKESIGYNISFIIRKVRTRCKFYVVRKSCLWKGKSTIVLSVLWRRWKVYY